MVLIDKSGTFSCVPCVSFARRCRYGAVNWEYNWSDSSDDDEDYSASLYTDSGAGSSSSAATPLSPRSARIWQQQAEAQEARNSRGPRVLKPEGAALLRPASPAPAAAAGGGGGGGGQSSQSGCGGGRGSRSPSPTRPIPEPYPLPSEGDDLVAVVRTFLDCLIVALY